MINPDECVSHARRIVLKFYREVRLDYLDCCRSSNVYVQSSFCYLGAMVLTCIFTEMFQTVAKAQTTELWMWKMEYLHHEQRPLYFGEWF